MGMRMCFYCDGESTCVDSRQKPEKRFVRRRYKCVNGHSFYTQELVEPREKARKRALMAQHLEKQAA